MGPLHLPKKATYNIDWALPKKAAYIWMGPPWLLITWGGLTTAV